VSTARPAPCSDEERVSLSLVELRHAGVDSTKDSSRSYDQLHSEGHLRQQDSFYLWLLSILPARQGEMLLDVSCGQGALLRWCAAVGLRGVGLDLSSSAVAAAAREAPEALAVLGNAERLPFPDALFQYVTNIGSVEHYFDPHGAIREMARVQHPDGLALILLPNTFGLLGNVLHVWRTGDVFDDGQPIQRYGTAAQWRRLLEMNGLTVVRTLKCERAWPRTWRDLGWFARRPHRMVRVLLSHVIPLHLSSFLVYLCRKTQ
jgi:ubiquinone/menaquinone biosynthesis C-methylase UbiE